MPVTTPPLAASVTPPPIVTTSNADASVIRRLDQATDALRQLDGELHRVDGSHRTDRRATTVAKPPRQAPVAKFSARESAQDVDDLESWVNEIDHAELIGRDRWLALHATDLISRIQAWMVDLDAREANLNAAQAQHDIRERKFRVYQQEIEAQMAEHNRAATQLRNQIREHARRVAFQST